MACYLCAKQRGGSASSPDGKMKLMRRTSAMARIPILDEYSPDTPTSAKLALEAAGQARGRGLNVYRALANRPEALAAFTGLVQTVYRGNSTLDPRHGELAYLTATAVNDCFY